MKAIKKVSGLAVAATLALSSLSTSAAPALESYNVDTSEISISGLSSGAFMAVQMHVSYSNTFMGVGSVAGGVYYCAEGTQGNATGRCMAAAQGGSIPSGSYFKDKANSFASQGKIDATSNMNGDKVWIFTGANDSVVNTEDSDRLRDFYEFYTNSSNITYIRNTIGAEHAMPTQDHGNSCGYKGDPYINDCNYDTAGEILSHIYGNLNARTNTVSSNLKDFDQSAFHSSFYLHNDGYIYVPDSCDAGATCKLHVALHGCVQNKNKVGNEYALHTGYNQWAESNNIIVLYPQTSLSATNQCWDWWGYADLIAGGEYHVKSGSQMSFLKDLVDHVAGGSGGNPTPTPTPTGNPTPTPTPPPGGNCTEHYDSNWNHVNAGRATTCNSWYACATGSGDNMGLKNIYTYRTLAQTSPGYYELGSCP